MDGKDLKGNDTIMLKAGTHTLEVEAMDNAGNIDIEKQEVGFKNEIVGFRK